MSYKRGAIVGRGDPPGIFAAEDAVKELSVFVDESGDVGTAS